MKQWNGLWFPDAETHYMREMGEDKPLVNGKPTYQFKKYWAAASRCRHRRTAVDVGANVGLWSRVMLHDFECVEAFEPVPEYADCFVKNAPGAILHRVALGVKKGFVTMVRPDPSVCGHTRVASDRTDLPDCVVARKVRIRPIDDFNLKEVDLFKVDCEGYELNVLQGAEQTLLRCKPVVIVEQKPGNGSRYTPSDKAAVHYLHGLGAKSVAEIAGDFILDW